MATKLNPTSLLLEALTSRSGSAVNPALQALLSGTAPAETAGAPAVLPSAEELIGQLESTNPTLGLVARYLSARRATESDDSTEADHEVEDDGDQDQRLLPIIQRLEQQVSKLRTELEQLRAHNDACAAALGACYLCWGEDGGCPLCHGTGRPGFALPDRQLLAQFVAPAMRRLQAHTALHRRHSTHPPRDDATQPVQTVQPVNA